MSVLAVDILHRLFDEVINGDRLDLIDELFAAEYQSHGPFPWGVHTRNDLRRFGFVRALGFPDAEVTLDEVFSSGELVAYTGVLRATNTAEILGVPPTGGRMQIRMIGIFRLRGTQLVEHWGLVDELGLLQQIGITPDSIRSLVPTSGRSEAS
jgi:predicted ester cyclase